LAFNSELMPAAARLILKRGREKSLRRRHPWIFSGAVERLEGNAAAGTTVDVVSADGELLARAAYSPRSQIRARAWAFGPAEIDAAFIAARVRNAVELRRRFGLLEARDACRLVFAESDGLPGTVVDRYANVAVCQFLAAGAEHWREAIADAVLASDAGVDCVFERSEASVRGKEGLPPRRGPMRGVPPATLEIALGALRQSVDVAGGQKTGAYLDQWLNRERVAAYARGGRVLDAFSYSGGFAISCLLAGATDALLVDSSADALAIAQREAEANGVAARTRFAMANVFDELRALRDRGERFDVVVLDPPKFVHTAEQVKAGSRGYKDVNMLGLALAAPGGILATFSCSGHVDAALFQKIVAGAAVNARRDAQILERLTQPPDHPVALEFPEAEYLKGLVLRVQ
jgi:23S rRNA (cytosine1962-C5)-methyltransferase